MDEIESLMLKHFNGNDNLYIRWMLRYNEDLKSRPVDLCERGEYEKVLNHVKSITEKYRFLKDIGQY